MHLRVQNTTRQAARSARHLSRCENVTRSAHGGAPTNAENVSELFESKAFDGGDRFTSARRAQPGIRKGVRSSRSCRCTLTRETRAGQTASARRDAKHREGISTFVLVGRLDVRHPNRTGKVVTHCDTQRTRTMTVQHETNVLPLR